jgi:hypothetical protein
VSRFGASAFLVLSLSMASCGSSAAPTSVAGSTSASPAATGADAQTQRYRGVLQADWKPLDDQYIASPCLDSQVQADPGACRAGTAALRDLSRGFLDDLAKVSTPAAFRAADTDLKAALSDLITACNAGIAALDANDRPAFATASEAIGAAHRAAARAQATMRQ